MQTMDTEKQRKDILIFAESPGADRKSYEMEGENKHWEDDENGMEYAPFCYT